MRWLLGLLLALSLGFTVEAEPRKPRVAIVSIELAAVPNLARAAARRVEGRMTVDLYGLGGGLLPSVEGADLPAYDLVLVEGVGPQLLNFADRFAAAKTTTKVVVVNGERWIQGNVAPAELPDLQTYWTNATEENYAALFDYLGVRLLDLPGSAAPPQVYPDAAFYHPTAPGPFADRAAYDAWAASRFVDAATRPRIGLLFYRSLVLSHNAAVIDALIAEVERLGGLPVPLWRKDSAESLATLAPPGRPVDAVILCSNWIDYADHAAGAQAARALDAAVLNCATDYRRTPEQWAAEPGGFAPDRTGQLALSEIEGIVEPMMVGARALGPEGTAVNTPISHQVTWRVARALAWAGLKRKANSDKRLVIPYFSEGRNQADVGSDPDSYLDAQASLVVLLQRLKAEGYDLGDQPLPDKAALSKLMAEHGSNPRTPAEIAARVADGSAVLVSEADYLRWWAELPHKARQSVEAQWGPPPGDLMVHVASDGGRSLVIPRLTFGKVAIAPHPIWGMQEDRGLVSKGALTPHHQYVAFYLWMAKAWKADAYLPLFTQLSLMPGKQEGPSSQDWVGLLIGDLPHIQPTPLQANGGVANKRRANATLIGFMPEITWAGLPPDVEALRADLAKAEGDRSVQATVRSLATAFGWDKALDLDIAATPWSALAPALSAYIEEISRAPMPHGGHVLGVAPPDEVAAKMVQAMVASDGDGPTQAQVALALGGGETALDPPLTGRILDYAARIRAAPAELDAVIGALAGRYVVPGPNQDAIRNPDALPGGRNPYTLDPRALPTPQAWATGARLADEMVAAYAAKHGRPMRKAAFVLWSGETVQNGAVLESQILRLLGARPVWNPKGQVVDVALDDPAALGRGRIDVLVTTSGTYRDHFGDKISLIAKAVRLAAASPEPGNAVREAVSATRARLVAQGVTPEDAELRAHRRVFSTAPGAYSPATEFAVKADPRWSDARLAKLYADRLGHAYGEASDAGAADGAAFSDNLKTVDAAVFSRTSNVYGLLDTPMPAAYLGGLNMAVRAETGRKIETYIAQLQSPTSAKVEEISKTFGRELRSRYFNPAWIKAMQAGGYNGARYMSEFTDHMLLWDVTTPDLATDRDWQEVAEVYIRDRYKLGLMDYFAKSNPAARRQLVETLLEAADRGGWRPDAETLRALQRELAGPGEAPAPGERAARQGGGNAPAAVLTPPLRGFEMQEVVRRPHATAVAPRNRPSPLVALIAGLGALLLMAGAVRQPAW